MTFLHLKDDIVLIFPNTLPILVYFLEYGVIIIIIFL